MSIVGDIVDDILDRLAAATATGKLLAGYKLAQAPVSEVEGASDLPSVRVFLPDVAEEYTPRTMGACRIRFKLTVSVARSAGIEALQNATALVLDVLELDASGNPDPTFGGLLAAPFAAAYDDGNFITDLSLTNQITLTMDSRRFVRGNRRGV